MPRPTSHVAARAAVDRLSAPSSDDRLDDRALRGEVLDVLRRALGFRWHVWVLTDPRSCVGVDPVARVPDLAALPGLVRLKYTTALNRWTSLRDVAALGRARTRSDLWRHALRAYGVADVASVVLRDRYGCWAFLDLWSERRFDDDDLALLRVVAPPLTRALRARRAGTFARAAGPPPVTGPAVLLLDDRLCITGHTGASAAWAELLLPRPDGAAVPAAAYNVAAQLVARERGVDEGEPVGRTPVADGQWLTLRASRVVPAGQIAVAIEPSSATDRLDVFARASALSRRETELVEEVARGNSTAQIASRLHLSPYTVQDHLTAVFDKTGVRSRRDLVSRVLGVRVTE